MSDAEEDKTKSEDIFETLLGHAKKLAAIETRHHRLETHEQPTIQVCSLTKLTSNGRESQKSPFRTLSKESASGGAKVLLLVTDKESRRTT